MTSQNSVPAWRHRVAASEMVPLAQILRDPNPIHLDAAVVAALGLGDRVINQGPANLAYIINMLTIAFPDHRLEALESRFLANVKDGDVVEASGVIIEQDDDRIICDASLGIIGGSPAVKARATLSRRAT